MAKTERPQSEPDRHREAFEYYRALGPKRTYKQVAEQLGVSLSSVKAWARKGRWRDRLREHEANAARQAADRVIQGGASETGRNLKIVRVALMKVAKAIAEGKVKIQMGDLDRLIRLEGYLLDSGGDPVVSLLRRLPEHVRDRVTEIIRNRLLPLVSPSGADRRDDATTGSVTSGGKP